MIECHEPIQHQLETTNYIIKTIKVDWNSCCDAYMHVFTDVTSVKNYEKEKALNECLYILFSSMSHEFRTPLNTVCNSITLLANKIEQISLIVKNNICEDNKDYQIVNQISAVCNKYSAMANISSKILTNSIENILDLVKVEARNLDLNVSNFPIKSITEEIKFIFEEQCIKKQLYFRVNCAENLIGSFFTSDLNRIKQILINLVSNSFKFTDRGGIAIFIDKVSKRNLNCFKDFLKIKVADTGIGISNEEQKQIYKVFGAAKNKEDVFSMKGLGLGLTISHKLISAMDGEIKMKSELGIGTEIVFIIPSANEEWDVDLSLSELVYEPKQSTIMHKKIYHSQNPFRKL